MPEGTSTEAKELAKLKMLDQQATADLYQLRHEPRYWSALLKEKRRLERALNRTSDPATHTLNYRPYMGSSPLLLMQEINELALDYEGRPVFNEFGRQLTSDEHAAYTYPHERQPAYFESPTGRQVPASIQSLTDPREIIRHRDEARKRESQHTSTGPTNPYSPEYQQRLLERDVFDPTVNATVQAWFNTVMPMAGWEPFTLPEGISNLVALSLAHDMRNRIVKAYNDSNVAAHPTLLAALNELHAVPQNLDETLNERQKRYYSSEQARAIEATATEGLDQMMEATPPEVGWEPPEGGVVAEETPAADLALPLGPKPPGPPPGHIPSDIDKLTKW